MQQTVASASNKHAVNALATLELRLDVLLHTMHQ